MRILQIHFGSFLSDLSLGGLLGAEEHLCRLGTSAAQKACKPEKLALFYGHADVFDLAGNADMLGFQHVLGVFFHIRAFQVEDDVDIFTDHLCDELDLVQFVNTIGSDQMSVPQDGHPVGDFIYLIQEMGDEDDPHSFGFQLPHYFKQKLDLVVIQRRGRFVQDQDLRLYIDSTGDGDHLLDGCRIEGQRPGHIDIQMEPGHQLIGSFVDGLPVDSGPFHGLAADEYVFRYRQVRTQVDFLEHGRDAQIHCLLGTCGIDFFSVQKDLPAVLMIDACQTFDQGGFPCSVFTEKRVHLAFAQSEIDFVQSFDAGKLYFNFFHLKNNIFRQVYTSLVFLSVKQGGESHRPVG